MTVTVYTAPACGGCFGTKRHLSRLHLDYTEKPIPKASELIAQHDLRTAPVVHAVLDDGTEQVWDGYRPDRIDALVR